MAAAVVVLAACACSGTQARDADGGCTKDVDCRAPRICERSICVDPRPAALAQVVPAPGDADAAGSAARAAGPAAKAPAAGPPPFAMYGGDARHTGRRGGAAPARQPKELWKVALGAPIAGSPTIGPDGTIYVTSHAGALHAIDPAGKPRWKLAMGDRSWSTPAVSEDGTIYVGSDDDHLYAVKPDGALRWKLRLGACDPRGFGPESSRCDVDGGPTIGPDGTIYVGGDGIHAVWPDGTLRWKVATAEHVASGPALGEDGTVYAGSQDDALYAIAPDGVKRWEVRTGKDVDAPPAIGADGTIYVGSDDHALYAISPAGAVKW